ncbi:phosphoserine phosphatase SerB [Sphingomonas edaphi]|uniref:phosphoserine phosphatase SerB n=1 Tax=Sphingomonas edaphi TaxID=2315689 RepID=UPI0018F79BA3|nr:phosphoserine phosphatase SerB [Sphingomonas edaphi]
MTIATLIAAGRLDERLLEAALARIHSAEFTRWIDRGDAADFESPLPPQELRQVLEGWEGADVIVHTSGPRQKRLLVADMDSTIIGQECIDELADYAGVKPQVADITERAMRGELDFAGALAERVALLEGLEFETIAQCLAERIRPNPGAETLVRTMSALGATTILVSGGFTAFVEPIARKVGFDRFEANVLEVAAGKLTGSTSGRIVDSHVKQEVLVRACEELELRPDETMAIGDGANDALMVMAAGLGIAYHAKPVLAEVADACLEHHGLDALLWAQGINRARWIED